jgi:hypothetical protein
VTSPPLTIKEPLVDNIVITPPLTQKESDCVAFCHASHCSWLVIVQPGITPHVEQHVALTCFGDEILFTVSLRFRGLFRVFLIVRLASGRTQTRLDSVD